MAGLIKQARRGLRRKTGEAIHRLAERSPQWLKTNFGPAFCYAEMLVSDYGFVRLMYNNRHRISKDAWRSAQPSPHHIAWASRHGVRTVINLRTDQSYGTRWLEERACKRHGLDLIDIVLWSRSAPLREDLLAVKTLLETVEYPVLIHCKSGADRAGLMSALYRIVREGASVEEAKAELALKFGHIRQADTGILDYFFERYLFDNAKTPITFWDWVATRYDSDEIDRTFKSSTWANRLVNGVLHRE
jgi:protein tyrosine/serine phosphatase